MLWQFIFVVSRLELTLELVLLVVFGLSRKYSVELHCCQCLCQYAFIDLCST